MLWPKWSEFEEFAFQDGLQIKWHHELYLCFSIIAALKSNIKKQSNGRNPAYSGIPQSGIPNAAQQEALGIMDPIKAISSLP
jgi:hypothetical protein